MRRLTVVLLFFTLLGAPSAAFSGELRREFERELAADGFATDDAGLRALVRFEEAPEDARSKAALLLALRGVKEAGEDVRAALATLPSSSSERTAMATALAYLDPVRYEPVIVEIAGQVDLRHRVNLAASLSEQGRFALYPVLVSAALEAGDWQTPHTALWTLVQLAKRPPAVPLDPDPFRVILGEVTAQRASGSQANRPAAAGIRLEAVSAVPEVLCHTSNEERAVAALTALRGAAGSDPASEVREAAAAGLETLADGLLIGRWPPYCGDPGESLSTHLRVRGRPVDDENLRALLRSPREPVEYRVAAARLLGFRGVAAAAPDLRAALLGSGFPDRDLAILAHALLRLGGAESVKIVVETAARLKDPTLKFYLAQDLAGRGEPALYDLLLVGVAKGNPVERHFALSAVAALAERVEAGRLTPSPVRVLIGQLTEGQPPLRVAASRGLAGARYATEKLRGEAVQALRKAAAGDPALDVKQAAAEAIKALEERLRDPRVEGER